MAESVQTNFLGGYWSAKAQGRFDDPIYKFALNECLNGLPVKEGSWTRRPGFLDAGLTRGGVEGKLLPLSISANPSHNVELTDSFLRLYHGGRLVSEQSRQVVSSISGASPAVVTLPSDHGWSNGDYVTFRLDGADEGLDLTGINPLLFRQFIIVSVSNKTFAIYDAATRLAVDGSTITFSSSTAQLTVARVLELPTPYSYGSWKDTGIVQSSKDAYLLHGSYAPLALALNNQTEQWALSQAVFEDGPYLDPISGVVAYVDRTHGVVNVYFSYDNYDANKSYSKGDFIGTPGTQFGWKSLQDANEGNTPAIGSAYWEPVTTLNGFANNGAGLTNEDFGRHVRLFSEPPDWASGTTYNDGDAVSYGKGADRTYWRSIAGSNLGVHPGDDVTKWVPDPTAAIWTWGVITDPRPLTVTVPGHWEVPGFKLTAQCSPVSSATYTGSNFVNIIGPHLTNISGATLDDMGYITHPTGGIYVTAPTTYGFGGGCGAPVATATSDVLGYNFGNASPTATGFVIAMFVENSFGSTTWFPFQYWDRVDPDAVPSQPIWVTTAVSADALDGTPGTPFGDMTDGAGIQKLFSTGTSEAFASRVGNEGYAGILLDTPSVIASGRCWPVVKTKNTEIGFAANGVTRGATIRMWAKATAPSNAQDGTLLGQTYVTGPLTSSAPVTVPSNDTTTIWSYVWFEIIADIVPDEGDETAPFGGGFDYGNSTYAVAASKMAFYTDYTIISGSSIGVQLRGDDLLYTGYVKNWRLGRYNGHMPTWPVAGCWKDGRLWLASDDNHFDASYAGEPLRFSPSLPDGSVTDACGISETLDAETKNTIHWMKAEEDGVLMGTSAGEWLITAASGAVISPTNITRDPVTAFGSKAVQPIVATLSTVFVHKSGRSIHEAFRDAYSGKVVAPSLQEKASSLTDGGLKQLAYQTSLTPIVWGCTELGSLIGTSYQRDNRVSWQPPSFNGWHRHEHGGNRSVLSVAGNVSLNGDLDTIAIVSKETDTGLCHVELMADPLEDADNVFMANFLDGAIVPHSGHITTNGVDLFGLWGLERRVVTVFLAGLDCGKFTITNGKVSVPWASDADNALTRNYLQQVSTLGQDFKSLAVSLDGQITVPVIVGFTYKSRGQRLRDFSPETGTGLGEVRRNHQFAALMHNTKGVKFGTNFDRLHPAKFVSDGQTPITATELFSGVYTDSIEDDSSTEGMIAWETETPYPTVIVAIGGFLKGTGK